MFETEVLQIDHKSDMKHPQTLVLLSLISHCSLNKRPQMILSLPLLSQMPRQHPPSPSKHVHVQFNRSLIHYQYSTESHNFHQAPRQY